MKITIGFCFGLLIAGILFPGLLIEPRGQKPMRLEKEILEIENEVQKAEKRVREAEEAHRKLILPLHYEGLFIMGKPDISGPGFVDERNEVFSA